MNKDTLSVISDFIKKNGYESVLIIGASMALDIVRDPLSEYMDKECRGVYYEFRAVDVDFINKNKIFVLPMTDNKPIAYKIADYDPITNKYKGELV